MTLTDLARLRLKINDRRRVTLRETVGLGDGGSTRYQTQMHPVAVDSEEVSVAGTFQTPTTDYTIDTDLGLLTFTSPPASGEEVVVSYQWSAFSDAELEDFLDRYANVTRAAIVALEAILADYDRFIKYTFGQESVDRSAAHKTISDLLDRLEQEMRGSARLVRANTPERENQLKPYVVPEYNDAGSL